MKLSCIVCSLLTGALILLSSGCMFTPKFKIGDCIEFAPTNLEFYDASKNRVLLKIEKIGKTSYYTPNAYFVDSYRWDTVVSNAVYFSEQDSYKKVECPK